jgi:hypothetical protein
VGSSLLGAATAVERLRRPTQTYDIHGGTGGCAYWHCRPSAHGLAAVARQGIKDAAAALAGGAAQPAAVLDTSERTNVRVVLYRVYNRKFEAYHHPRDPKGVMATKDRAWIWDNRADTEAAAAELNERDHRPEYRRARPRRLDRRQRLGSSRPGALPGQCYPR